MEESKTMPETLSQDHPNLVIAMKRLRRSLWAWAGLFVLIGGITFAVLNDSYPLAALPWFASAVLLLVGIQPAYLALVAVQWGLSILTLIPGVNSVIGPDPFTVLFDLSLVESIALSVVRILLLMMAWNQFMFYRMLYGTETASGLDDDLPAIPEVIPNKSDLLARISQLMGILGLLVLWGALLIQAVILSRDLATLGYACAIYAIGLGVGVVFSPTRQRKVALSGIGIGTIVILSLILVSQFVAV